LPEQLLKVVIAPHGLEDPVIAGVKAIRLSLIVLITEQESVGIGRAKLALQVCGECDHDTEVVVHGAKQQLIRTVALIQHILAP
jgi:MinD superfamily P-loop ATPase